MNKLLAQRELDETEEILKRVGEMLTLGMRVQVSKTEDRDLLRKALGKPDLEKGADFMHAKNATLHEKKAVRWRSMEKAHEDLRDETSGAERAFHKAMAGHCGKMAQHEDDHAKLHRDAAQEGHKRDGEKVLKRSSTGLYGDDGLDDFDLSSQRDDGTGL